MIMDDDSVKGLVSTWSLAAKPCESCKTSPAILFCRPHSAFLCAACDADLHPNLLHERVLICDVCEQFPADVTCKADSAALCAACDRHIHSANPLAGRHHRLPVLPFFQTPSAAFDTNWPNDVSSFLDFNLANLSHETPCTRSFVADSEAKSITYPDGYGYAGESCFQIDFSQSKYNHSAQSISHTVSSSESGVVPEGASYSGAEVSNSTNSYDGLSVQTLQATEMDRRARVMRYREKKKRRKFQKTIRYASRKAYAERRPRVKGRFAKRIDADSDAHREVVEQIGFVVDHGVVPLF